MHPDDADDHSGWKNIMDANNNFDLPDAIGELHAHLAKSLRHVYGCADSHLAFLGVSALLNDMYHVRLHPDDNLARQGKLQDISDGGTKRVRRAPIPSSRRRFGRALQEGSVISTLNKRATRFVA